MKREDFLTSELITTCAGSGCAATSCELALQYSKFFPRSHEQTFLEILVSVYQMYNYYVIDIIISIIICSVFLLKVYFLYSYRYMHKMVM